MPTNNTDFELFEIRVSPLVGCGHAHIVDTSFVSELTNISILGPCKRFVIFVCCEDQKIHAENNAEEIMRLCQEMIKNKSQVFHIEATIHRMDEQGKIERRILH